MNSTAIFTPSVDGQSGWHVGFSEQLELFIEDHVGELVSDSFSISNLGDSRFVAQAETTSGLEVTCHFEDDNQGPHRLGLGGAERAYKSYNVKIVAKISSYLLNADNFLDDEQEERRERLAIAKEALANVAG